MFRFPFVEISVGWLTAKNNVCASTGHVSRDRDRSFSPSLGDNFCFLGVILCVEDVMGNAPLFQQAA